MSSSERAKSTLDQRRRDLADRIASIERSRQRAAEPLSADSGERAVECENDEVLDRLAETTRAELAQVVHALGRIDAGLYGTCEGCGEAIAPSRLRALPEATRCSACAAPQGRH